MVPDLLFSFQNYLLGTCGNLKPMKVVIGLIVILGLTCRASAGDATPDLAAIKAQEDAATMVYLSCLDRAGKHLDDHKSDPASIAQGALSVCGKEFSATVEAFSRHYDNYLATREKVESELRQTSKDFAIQRILINRKGGAKRH